MPALARIASDEALPAEAEAVVIGGGIVGVSAAYFLARKGVRVALVEKGQVGAEQSSRNWGWCRLHGRSLPEVPLARESLAIWGSLSREAGLDLGYRQAGLLAVSDNPAEVAYWEAWLERTRDFQLDGRILRPADLAAMLPNATGARWAGGLYSPTDAVAEPAKAAPAIAEAARALGATIHQNCAARGMETTGGRVSGLITEAGRIRTSAILCAGGAWTSMFCRRHGIALPQAGVFAAAARTSAGPEVNGGGITTDTYAFRRRDDGAYTVAIAGGGRVELTPQNILYAMKFLPLFLKRRRKVRFRLGTSFLRGPEGFARWPLDRPSPFEATRVLDPPANGELIERAMAHFRADYPVLKDLRVEEAWGGLIDSTPDARPVISAVDALPGFHVAAGFSGHGFGMGPGGGRLAADLITGATPVVDPTPFRYARLVDGTRLRPSPWD